MNPEVLLRSALEADADDAPNGAGMVVLVRRRAAVRKVRVRTAGALAAVLALAGTAGAATLLPLSGGSSLPPPPAVSPTVRVTPVPTVTPTPTPTRPGPSVVPPGLVAVPAFTPPELLLPGYLPADFSTGNIQYGTDGEQRWGSWISKDHGSRLVVRLGPGPALPPPSVVMNDEVLKWRPATVAGQPGQQAEGLTGTFLRWHLADGRVAGLFFGRMASWRGGAFAAEAHRIADGLRPAVPDWRLPLQPRLMPAGWAATGASVNAFDLARAGRTVPRMTIIVAEPDGTYPVRVGGHPARWANGTDGNLVLHLRVDAGHEVTVYAYADAGRPSRKQVEAIALAVEVNPSPVPAIG